MPRNGSGTFSVPPGTNAVPGATIASAPYNAFLADLATEITDSLDRSGKGGMLAALNMGNFRITGLGTPTGVTDAVTKAYVDSSANSGLTGQLFGLTLSNDSGGTTAIAVAAGSARDSTDTSTMALASALTGKVLANAWTVGNAGGFLDTGAVANTTYHVYLIKRPDTSVVDAIASTSASAPTLPANYTLYRRIGSIVRTGGAIKLFKQDGDRFRWTAASVQDVNATNPGTAAVTRTLTVPTGIVVWADVALFIQCGTSVGILILVTALDETDRAASGTDHNFGAGYTSANSANAALSPSSLMVKTDTSAQIRSRQSASGASDIFQINTFGWVDQRGRLY